jgi:hypothetical protein
MHVIRSGLAGKATKNVQAAKLIVALAVADCVTYSDEGS